MYAQGVVNNGLLADQGVGEDSANSSRAGHSCTSRAAWRAWLAWSKIITLVVMKESSWFVCVTLIILIKCSLDSNIHSNSFM